MNKKFEGKTILRPNNMFHFLPSKELHITTLEDIDFEKKYDVFTDNDIEARYLLTTAFMERLKNMQTAFKTNKTSVAFFKEKLYITFYTNKDLFKLGSLFSKNICYEEQILKMFEEVLSIIMLIDYFKLNLEIGL